MMEMVFYISEPCGSDVLYLCRSSAAYIRLPSDGGRVVAFDNHENLMKTCDVYRDIYNSQMREGAEQVG